MSLSDLHSRHRLLWRVAAFRDRRYQDRVWVRGEMPRESYYDDIDDAINDFFDALARPAGTGPEDDIGVIFENSEEALAVEQLAAALDAALKAQSSSKIGGESGAAELIGSGEWAKVVSAAEVAGRALGVPLDTDLLR